MTNTVKKGSIFSNSVWSISIRMIQALLTLVVNILVARYLGPQNFGVLNYVISFVEFFLPFVKLGIDSVLVQELLNHPEEEGKIIGTTFVLALSSSFVCYICASLTIGFANFSNSQIFVLCLLYSLMLFFYSLELIRFWFQSKLIYKYFSLSSLIAYIFLATYKIILLLLNKDVYWFAISYSIDYLIIDILSFIFYRKLGGEHLSFSWKIAKRIFSKSKFYILSDLAVTIFVKTDVIMLKHMIPENGETLVGLYTAALSTVNITAFIFSSISESFRPIICELEESGKHNECLEKTTDLYCIINFLSIFQTIAFLILGKYLIRLLYGQCYMGAVGTFKVLSLYTFFAAFGLVRNVLILAENKHKYIAIVNTIGAVINILINFILIPMYGLLGAAVASLITQFITNFVIVIIIKPLRENIVLIGKSLNPKRLFNIITKVINNILKRKNQS